MKKLIFSLLIVTSALLVMVFSPIWLPILDEPTELEVGSVPSEGAIHSLDDHSQQLWEKLAEPLEDQSEKAKEELQKAFLRTQNLMVQRYQKIRSAPEFSMSPYSVISSAAQQRCDSLRRQLDAMAKEREFLEHEYLYQNTRNLCEQIFFAWLDDTYGLEIGQEAFWANLQSVDQLFQEALTHHASVDEENFIQIYEGFQKDRQSVLGADLDQTLFSLGDEVVLLPYRTKALAVSTEMDSAEKASVFREQLSQIEATHSVRVTKVFEPIELARMELSLLGSDGDSQEKQYEVIAHYAGEEFAQSYLARTQAERKSELSRQAYEQERAQMVAQLGDGLSSKERLQKLNEIDDLLITKHNIK